MYKDASKFNHYNLTNEVSAAREPIVAEKQQQLTSRLSRTLNIDLTCLVLYKIYFA